ncbi:12541_t:CDS:2, partial [Racocetra persica]
QHEEEEEHFQNEFAKRRKTNSYQTIYAKSSVQSKDKKISLNNIKSAIRSITSKQTVNQLKPSDNHKNKTELPLKDKSKFLDINNDNDHFEHNKYNDHFENNEYDIDNEYIDRFEDNKYDNIDNEYIDRFEDND